MYKAETGTEPPYHQHIKAEVFMTYSCYVANCFGTVILHAQQPPMNFFFCQFVAGFMYSFQVVLATLLMLFLLDPDRWFHTGDSSSFQVISNCSSSFLVFVYSQLVYKKIFPIIWLLFVCPMWSFCFSAETFCNRQVLD